MGAMSRHSASGQSVTVTSLGVWLRRFRVDRKLPLRVVAAAAEIDSTLLSKIELGKRLPTEAQAEAVGRFFGIPAVEMRARRLAEKFRGEKQKARVTHRALEILRAEMLSTADSGRGPRHGARAARRAKKGSASAIGRANARRPRKGR